VALGEPPAAIHPVVWMGKIIAFLARRKIGASYRAEFVQGCLITLITLGLFIVPAYFLLFYLRGANYVAYVIVAAMLLKCTFSVKEMFRAALGIKRLLLEGKLDEARFELRSLVSRETRNLSEPQVVSAVVESVAENTSDSLVAPLFYFLIFGVPGAVFYRVVNTMDAMIGYHGEYEYLGKFASRLDDVLNFIPARLTALLLVLAAALSKKNAPASWRTMLSDHACTESPNAGWPMAAVAGALDVQLEKVGNYKLGRPGAGLVPATIDGALKLVLAATLSWIVLCFVVGIVRYAVTT